MDTIKKITASVDYPVDLLAFVTETQALLSNGANMNIDTADDLAFVRDTLIKIKAAVKKVESDRMEMTEPFRDGASEINALFKPFKDWADTTEKLGKKAMGAYQSELERKAREVQAAADARARKEREEIAKRVTAAEKRGHVEKAEALEERADTTVAEIKQAPKQKGQSKKWVVEITDMAAFKKHAAFDMYLASVLEVNQVALNRFAASIGNEDLQIPGAKITTTATFALRK